MMPRVLRFVLLLACVAGLAHVESARTGLHAAPRQVAATGVVAGSVVRATGGAPVSGVSVEFHSGLTLAGVAVTDDTGRFVSPALPAGRYTAVAVPVASTGLLAQVFSNRTCAPLCGLSSGTPITVVAGSTTSAADFALTTGGVTAGTVVRAGDGAVVPDVVIDVYAGSVWMGGVTTDAQGRYASPPLPSGAYTVVARPPSGPGLASQVYPRLSCSGRCEVTNGTPVPVAHGQTTPAVDFALPVVGRISGVVTDASTGGPVFDAAVDVFSDEAVLVDTARTDTRGAYASTSLPNGAYRVRVPSVGALAGRVYRDSACLGCPVTDGVAIPVAVGVETPAVDLALPPAPAATNDDATQAAVVSASPFQWIRNVSAATTGSGDPAVTCGNRSRSRSVWFSIHVGAAGTVDLNTFGSSYDTILSVYTGTPSSLTAVACNDDAGGTLQSQLSLSVDARQRLTVVVSAYGTDGGVLAFHATVPQPLLPVSVSATPATLRFGAVKQGPSGDLVAGTAPQSVTVGFVGTSTTSWTATTGAPWLVVTGGAGRGPGRFTATLSNTGNPIGGASRLATTITLTAPGAENSPLSIPVELTVDQLGGAGTAPPFGQIDTPAQDATGLVGAIGVTGWALDDVEVTGVRVYRDCLPFDVPASCGEWHGTRMVYIGDAAFVEGARPDVEGVFPTFPRASRGGWGYLMLTNLLPHVPRMYPYGGQGTLTLYAIATDAEGRTTLLGRSRLDHTPTTVTLANDSIAKPFGAIDTPGQGETVGGWLANFGWVLTPDRDTNAGSDDIVVPPDGSTIGVFIDGVRVGQVAYNQCRGRVGNPVPMGLYCEDDVASIFGNPEPQATYTTRTTNPTLFRNLDSGRAAIGAFGLDTTALANGLHTIAWGVTDSAGRTEGIGSRFFTVLNGSARASRRQVEPTRSALARADDPIDTTASVRGRVGFDPSGPFEDLVPQRDGVYRVQLQESGRLELQLGAVHHGALVVRGTHRALPLGSHLDAAGGVFSWAPPVGFIGTYRLAFARSADHVEIEVAVRPARVPRPDESEIRMHIDLADVAATSGEVVVAGWALDPQAAFGAGVDAVHVWAERRDVPGVAAEFLGTAGLGLERADVARMFGPQFSAAGFRFAGGRLTAGTWQVTAYVWNRRTGRWEDARTTQVVVR